MSQFKAEILSMIESIHQDKKMKNKVPNFVLKAELLQKVRDNFDESIKQLEAEGKIKIGSSLNDVNYQINE